MPHPMAAARASTDTERTHVPSRAPSASTSYENIKAKAEDDIPPMPSLDHLQSYNIIDFERSSYRRDDLEAGEGDYDGEDDESESEAVAKAAENLIFNLPGDVTAEVALAYGHAFSGLISRRERRPRARSSYRGKDVERGERSRSVPPQKKRQSFRLPEEPLPMPEKPRPKSKDPNLVEWDGPNDLENPQNFATSKKWRITVLMGMLTFMVTFASSVFSTATLAVAELYDVSTEVATLGTSFFVLGFAVGPICWGPMSELFGRKKPIFAGYIIFIIFQIPVAVAQNFYTIVLCRFFGGVFGSAPLAIVAGALADMFSPIQRGYAVAVFAAATFMGPVAGPVMGGFITQSYLGWRWTAYMTAIMGAFFGTLGILFIPETAHATLLQNRAAKLRHETKNWAIHAKADETPVDFHRIVSVYLMRPFQMLFQEPILLAVTAYMALIYGLIYLTFEAYPIAFQEQRGWNQGVGALPFISILVGVLIGCLIIVYMTRTRYTRNFHKHGRAIPEERLPPAMIGAVILPAGLFWFAWTSDPSINWVPSVLAGVAIGCGILMIFLQMLTYLVDVYMWHANSAIAGNTVLRSLAGAGFPLFATGMIHNLGLPWAMSLLGFLCAALAPVPVLFFWYGERLRKMSKHSPSA